ncbi:MAG TPA: hypothetical protein PLO61_10055 [Fimbriimonadaceae bacterium]|nr:hypothetical protein [Fimbriimonadaceae bacterium]HRJ33952.1 hypothetical protein [Fimbriimonadaceae bacterium]
MKNRKSLLLLMAASIMALAVVGCGGPKVDELPPAKGSAATDGAGGVEGGGNSGGGGGIEGGQPGEARTVKAPGKSRN